MILAVLEAFDSQIMQRALLGGLVAATITALVGTWVVVRGLAFFGDALAHGVLPGIALAVLWGVHPIIGAVVSALAMVLGVNLVHRMTQLSDDTGIGLLFVGMLALGVVIISRSSSFTGDLAAFLFGDVLGVRTSDIWIGAVGIVLTIIVLTVGHRSFLAISVSRDKAAALGLRPAVAHIAMLATLALAVVVSFRVVGTLLVFGFLVAPPATAALLARSLPRMMVGSVLFGWTAVFIGLLVSYHADTAASATIAGVAVLQFFVVLAMAELHNVTYIPARLRR